MRVQVSAVVAFARIRIFDVEQAVIEAHFSFDAVDLADPMNRAFDVAPAGAALGGRIVGCVNRGDVACVVFTIRSHLMMKA